MTLSEFPTDVEQSGTTSPPEPASRPELLARYQWAAQAVAGKTVLDLGPPWDEGRRILRDAGAEQVAGSGEEPSHVDLVLCLDETASAAAIARDLHRMLAPEGVAIVASSDERVLEELAGSFPAVARYGHSQHLVSVISGADSGAQLLPGEEATDALVHLIVAAKGALPVFDDAVVVEGGAAAESLRQELEATLLERDRALRQVERARTQEQHAAAERDRLAERLLDAEQAAAASAKLEREMREQVAIVNAMKNTVSWRVTAPLRWLRLRRGPREPG